MTERQEYRKKYYWDHREKAIAYAKNYLKTHPEKKKEKYKKYAIKHKEELRQKRIEWAKIAQEYRNLVLARLGGKCQLCGFKNPVALQIDHINGGGCQDRNKKHVALRYYYKRLLEDKHLENKFQVLCANCNWIKRYTNKEFRKI